ncbi:SusC/RagA family TonB-linked outer membrane protein [Mariniphaga sediminis]|uniref:SusC/RagA family TonB-linked outer membrane protein n=3 Tax=Mariniphaga sediminis TaxID=1628158 RepID=A0A399CYD3_9BACT|nr:SusC/RagA family TonB-linked outer membrane protein [Mariniphaga sediminis]
MKKTVHPVQWVGNVYFVQKFLLIMRLTVFLTLFTFLHTLGIETYSQETKISLSFKDAPLKEVFRSIEKETDFRFMYSSAMIDVDKKINVNLERELISEVLEEILRDTEIQYKINGRQILLSFRDERLNLGADSQQPILVEGKVTDSSNQPLPGVAIVVKGTTQGTVTDANGGYSLPNIPENATLVFSFVGMRMQEVVVGDKKRIDVEMQDETIGIDEVVAVAYGVQKKTSVTASVSSLKAEEIASEPVSNLTNSLGGKLSGVIVRQVSGQPGSDGSNIYIRGIATTGSSSPLVIVDGIPRSFDELDPNSIENITILKDAAAVAPYGVAGANGVVLVTTKRGSSGEPTIKYNGYYGIQNPTFLPDFVNLEQYAQLRNRIATNAGQPIPWTDERLQLHLSGDDPERYPNWDVLGTIIEKNTPITNHNIEVFGGNEKVKYYASLGFQRQNGMWETDYENRYSLIMNLDANVTNTTKVSFNVNGRIQKHIEPAVGEMVNQGPEWIMQLLSYAHPDMPLFFNNGLYGTYITPAVYASGEKKTNTTAIYTQLSLEQELPFIPGLSLKGTFAYDPTFIFAKAWQKVMHIHTLDVSTDPYSYIDGIWGPSEPILNERFRKFDQYTWQGSLNYNQSFGKNNISALALFEGKENTYHYMAAGRRNYSILIDELNMGSSAAADISNSGSSTLARQLGLVYRLSYNYDNKYLIETSGRYDGHYYFAPGKKWGFFPSVAVGWRLSEENFIKQNLDWVNNIKLRASYGEVGALAGSAFQYLSAYNAYGPAHAFDGNAVNAVRESAEANKNITWERAKKTDIGLEVNLWKGMLHFEADYFYEKRSNMLVNPNVVVPREYGIGLSQVNQGVMENRGIDLSLGSNYKVSNDLEISLNGTFTYARNKILEVFETSATYDNPNRRLTGKPLGVIFGYNALGYFTADDFDAEGNLKPEIATQPWGAVQPGDLRYEDVSKDGKIDNNDIVQIGKSRIPEIIYGISPNVRYKKFNLTLNFQGAGNANFRLHGAGAWPFWGNRAAYVSHLDNWTPENTDARYPRLVAGQTTNNQQVSTWWVENTSYLRLKSATLSYNVPSFICNKIGMQNARIFLAGQNLYTWTSVINFDPEMNNSQSWDYPQQTVYSVGVNLTF